MQGALNFCLQADLSSPKIADMPQWRRQWRLQTESMNFQHDSIAAAVSVGFHAQSVAWAFLSGYQSAIRRLLSANDIDLPIPADAIIGFSVSEKAGNSPRNIGTRFDVQPGGQLTIDGSKSWVIAGDDCDWMVVSGINQSTSGPTRTNLSGMLDVRLAAVAATDNGVSFIQNPPTRFIPEVVHGGVALKRVQLPANRLLPGDGHQRYVKPFRSLEDTHIAAAILAYLVRCGREHQWPAAVTENNLGLIVSMHGLSLLDPALASTHLALTGVLKQLQQSYDDASGCWEHSTNAGDAPTRWQRDRALFDVAQRPGKFVQTVPGQRSVQTRFERMLTWPETGGDTFGSPWACDRSRVVAALTC